MTNTILTKTTKKKIIPKLNQLHKCLTGIKGFDEVTEGGLPKNRTTLVSGGAGSGKNPFWDLFFNQWCYQLQRTTLRLSCSKMPIINIGHGF